MTFSSGYEIDFSSLLVVDMDTQDNNFEDINFFNTEYFDTAINIVNLGTASFKLKDIVFEN